MQTYLWNPWSIFNELERSMFAAAREGRHGIAAEVKVLLGGDKEKKQAA